MYVFLTLEALGHAGVRHDEFLQKAGSYASAHQGGFGAQEMFLDPVVAAGFGWIDDATHRHQTKAQKTYE